MGPRYEELAWGGTLDEVELIRDGDGFAVTGRPKAVESYLRAKGLWRDSKELDMRRLRSLPAVGANVLKAASQVAENSGRWVKLTEESARRVAEHGLMESKTAGENHLMVGIPGEIASWLQAETGPGSVLGNPAVLSGVAGLMAQVAAQQSMAEITAYLASIDEKVDDVLRKLDDAMVADLVGVGRSIERAMTIRDEVGEVDEILWSTVDQAHATIGSTQSYALDQLKAVKESLERTKASDLADKAERAEFDVQRWLAVLARCFQLQEAVDVLEIERRMSESAETLDRYLRGMRIDRDSSRQRISQQTEALLGRMDEAVARANGTRLWHRTKSTVVIESGNHVAVNVHRFHELLEIDSELRSWELEPLGRAANFGSKSIQKAKDGAPAAAAVGMAAIGALAAVKHSQGDSSA